jgi:hypothetical protein
MQFKITMDPDSRDVFKNDEWIGMVQKHNTKKFIPKTQYIDLETLKSITQFLETWK